MIIIEHCSGNHQAGEVS